MERTIVGYTSGFSTGIAIDEMAGYYCLPQLEDHRQQEPADKSTDDENSNQQTANSTVKCVECLAVKRPALIVIPNTESCPMRWNKVWNMQL